MTMLFEPVKTTLSVETIPDADEIQCRFKETFSTFLFQKKRQAVLAALPIELRNPCFARNEAFVQRVVSTLRDEALEEKPFIYLTVDPTV